jgi:hypothetical protein
MHECIFHSVEVSVVAHGSFSSFQCFLQLDCSIFYLLNFFFNLTFISLVYVRNIKMLLGSSDGCAWIMHGRVGWLVKKYVQF